MKFSAIAATAVAIASVSSLHNGLTSVKRGSAKSVHHKSNTVPAPHHDLTSVRRDSEKLKHHKSKAASASRHNLTPVKRGSAKSKHNKSKATSASHHKSKGASASRHKSKATSASHHNLTSAKRVSAKAIFKAKSAKIDSKLHDAFEKFTSMLDSLLTIETEEDLNKLEKQLQETAESYEGLNDEQKDQLNFAVEILDEILDEFLNDVANPKEGTIMKDIKFAEALKNLKTQDDKNELIKKIEASSEKLINANKDNEDRIIEIVVEDIILHDLISYLKLHSKKEHNKPINKSTESKSLSDVVGLEALLKNIKSLSEIDGVLIKVDEAYNKLKPQALSEDQKVGLEVEYLLIKEVLGAIKNGGTFTAKLDSIAGYRKIEDLICKANTALDYDKALQEVDIGYVELLAKNPKREIELKAEHKILREIILEIKVFNLNIQNNKPLVTRSKDAMIRLAKSQIKKLIDSFSS